MPARRLANRQACDEHREKTVAMREFGQRIDQQRRAERDEAVAGAR